MQTNGQGRILHLDLLHFRHEDCTRVEGVESLKSDYGCTYKKFVSLHAKTTALTIISTLTISFGCMFLGLKVFSLRATSDLEVAHLLCLILQSC